MQAFYDGPGRDRTCDLGIKSPARQHAAGCSELKDAANRADDRCSKQQRAAPNGDKRLRALYARQLALWTTSSELGRPRRRRRSLSEGGADTVSRPTGPAVGAGELCLDAPPGGALITRLLQSTGQRCTFGAERIETLRPAPRQAGPESSVSSATDRSPGRETMTEDRTNTGRDEHSDSHQPA